MINLILFGPPGSGKGTQAANLVDKYKLVHISTGDLFRYELSNDTPLGIKAKEFMSKGELVPDEITIGMLENKVNKHPNCNGFIFDGFPRTIPQAEALENLMSSKGTGIDSLISLKVNKEEVVNRILERGKTSGRADDTDRSIVENRFTVYDNETRPVFEYFDKKGLSVEVDGMGKIDDVFERISAVIDSINGYQI